MIRWLKELLASHAVADGAGGVVAEPSLRTAAGRDAAGGTAAGAVRSGGAATAPPPPSATACEASSSLSQRII